MNLYHFVSCIYTQKGSLRPLGYLSDSYYKNERSVYFLFSFITVFDFTVHFGFSVVLFNFFCGTSCLVNWALSHIFFYLYQIIQVDHKDIIICKY